MPSRPRWHSPIRRTRPRWRSVFCDELLAQRHHHARWCSARCYPQSVDALFAEAEAPRHAHHRRQGADGPQRARGTARHRAERLRRLQGADRALARPRRAASTRSRRASPAPARRRSSMPRARCGASIPDVLVHTHIAENQREIAWTAKLFPERQGLSRRLRPSRPDRTARRAGAWRASERGRALPLPRERHGARALPDLEPVPRLRPVPHRAPRRIRAARCRSGSAPTSAAAPASRCSPRWARPTRSRSSAGARSSAVEAFYLATLGGARALALDDRIGTIAPGLRGRPRGARSERDAAADVAQCARRDRSRTCCSP